MPTGILEDLRYAIRALQRNRSYAAAAILATTLGVGITSAVFSAVDRVLFRPLPYAEEQRLVSVGMLTPFDTNEFLFPAAYFPMRRIGGPFEKMTAFEAGAQACDLTEANAVRLRCIKLERNFLETLGLAPARGRMFTADEDRRGGPPVAVISWGLWQERFAKDPNIVGKKIALDGVPTEIAGVLPREFLMPTLTSFDVVLPLALNEATERSGRALRVFAKLKPGLTVEQASAQMQQHLEAALADVPPSFRKEIKMRVRSVRDRQVGEARLASLALLGSVIAVLLLACANVANLLLARSAAREREMAVRVALGASRGRLARLALIESLVLGLAGGAAGCVLAYGLLRAVLTVAPDALPRVDEATLDGRVLLFACIASVLSGLLFGIAPALRRPAPEALTGTRSTPGGGNRLRAGLVMVQVALSLVLLTGAGLLLQSLRNLERVSTGMDAERVVSAQFVLPRGRYSNDARQLAFFTSLEERLARLPGVTAAALTDSLPPSGGSRGRPLAAIEIEGRERRPQGSGGMVLWRYVTPGYFQALGIPIRRGRGFMDADRAPDAYSMVISESLAKRAFPGEDPLGRRLLKGPNGEWFTVVGVAADVMNLGPWRASDPEYYVVRKSTPDVTFANQAPGTGWREGYVVARSSVDPALVAASLRQALVDLEPAMPVKIETVNQRWRALQQRPRFQALLFGLFAAVAVGLAALGLFGVLSFLALQRQREFGIRMALGATPAAIVGMVLRTAGTWLVAGGLIGVAGSLALARALRSLLYHVAPGDPTAPVLAFALLALAGLAAATLPAWRCGTVDPAETLRAE